MSMRPITSTSTITRGCISGQWIMLPTSGRNAGTSLGSRHLSLFRRSVLSQLSCFLSLSQVASSSYPFPSLNLLQVQASLLLALRSPDICMGMSDSVIEQRHERAGMVTQSRDERMDTFSYLGST